MSMVLWFFLLLAYAAGTSVTSLPWCCTWINCAMFSPLEVWTPQGWCPCTVDFCNLDVQIHMWWMNDGMNDQCFPLVPSPNPFIFTEGQALMLMRSKPLQGTMEKRNVQRRGWPTDSKISSIIRKSWLTSPRARKCSRAIEKTFKLALGLRWGLSTPAPTAKPKVAHWEQNNKNTC